MPEMPDEVSRLFRLVVELADDLELEINHRYEQEGLTALSQRQKERDLQVVERAREALDDYRQKYDCYW